ncbi:16584_t:CDS:2 [Gigaspora margarita]|uniref:16584_t:CDS:1 n=1 Tax=Gigaspora margarita TaxID=4874 RepID=A0ABM8W047_GIGMA|nr:16584_t:CDS:2 [Gigaspora margarita]
MRRLLIALGSERLCTENHPNRLSQQYIPAVFKQSPPDESHVFAVLTTAWIQEHSEAVCYRLTGDCYLSFNNITSSNTTTPKTRVLALVPKKRKFLDIVEKGSEKKMKKTHNTRSKDEKTLTLPKTTTTEVMDEEMSTFSGSSSENNTDSTSSDWSEVMERETTAENLQKQREDGVNSTNTDVGPALNEATKNKVPTKESKSWSGLFTKLTKGRATYSTFSPRINISMKNNNALMFDIQKLNNISTNDIVSTLYGKMANSLRQHYKELQNLKNKQVTSKEASETAHKIVEISAANPYKDNSQETDEQEAVVIEQDVNMPVVTNLLEVEDPRINPTSEEAVTPNNMKSTSNINQADSIIYGEKSNQIDSNRSYNQQPLTNSRSDNIIQQIVDNGFTKVTYSKKKKKMNKRDKKEFLGPYKKSKTSQ